MPAVTGTVSPTVCPNEGAPRESRAAEDRAGGRCRTPAGLSAVRRVTDTGAMHKLPQAFAPGYQCDHASRSSLPLSRRLFGPPGVGRDRLLTIRLPTLERAMVPTAASTATAVAALLEAMRASAREAAPM